MARSDGPETSNILIKTLITCPSKFWWDACLAYTSGNEGQGAPPTPHLHRGAPSGRRRAAIQAGVAVTIDLVGRHF